MYTEKRAERFRNDGQLLNSSMHRISITKKVVEGFGEDSFLWYINKKSNDPLSITIEEVHTLFKTHKPFNESLFK